MDSINQQQPEKNHENLHQADATQRAGMTPRITVS